MKSIKFVIPNGSLSVKLREYLGIAGYPVQEPDRTGFCGMVGEVVFYQLDRKMVPEFIACGQFEAGITGYDLWIASGVGIDWLRSIAELNFSRSTDQPTRWVLVSRKTLSLERWLDRTRIARIACELPILGKKLLEGKELPFCYDFQRIDGSEEQYVYWGMAEFALLVIETGKSITANGLKIFPGCEKLLVSTPRIIARPGLDPEREEELQALSCALQAVVAANTRVMVVFDFPSSVDLAAIGIPSSVAPTVSPLTDTAWKAGEICIQRKEIGRTMLKLREAGAKSINLIGLQGSL